MYTDKTGETFFNILLDSNQKTTQGYSPYRFEVIKKIESTKPNQLLELIK